MNKDNFTSLEFSKKLKDCGLESEYLWIEYKNGAWEIENKKDWKAIDDKWRFDTGCDCYDCESSQEGYETREGVPAFDILNDICVRHAKEFFGDDKFYYSCCDDAKEEVFDYNFHYRAKFVFAMMIRGSEGDRQAAEDYIWSHCLFNPKNK